MEPLVLSKNEPLEDLPIHREMDPIEFKGDEDKISLARPDLRICVLWRKTAGGKPLLLFPLLTINR